MSDKVVLAYALAKDSITKGYGLTPEEWAQQPYEYIGRCHKQCYAPRIMTKGDVLEFGVYGVYVCSGCGYAYPPKYAPDVAELRTEQPWEEEE